MRMNLIGRIGMFDKNIKIHEQLPGKNMLSFEPYLFAREDGGTHDDAGMSISDLNRRFPTWNAESMAEGLARLETECRDWAEAGMQVYPENEMEKRPELGHVRLFPFPGDPDKPSVILCAGGGYMAVCTMSESLPAAAKMQDLGYNAFVLNYRTAKGDGKPYFPTPIEDLAQAVRFWENQRVAMGIRSGKYAVCGFSAGANLVFSFSSRDIGYGRYGAAKPDAVFGIYGLADLLHIPEKMADVMFGKEHTGADLEQYDIITNVTEGFPKSFLAACRDDDVVPPENSIRLAEALRKCGTSVKLEIGESGSHGFGDGRGTSEEGWIERALAFWEDGNGRET